MSTVIVKVPLMTLTFAASVTLMVMFDSVVAPDATVPVITPVDGVTLRPVGSMPPLTA